MSTLTYYVVLCDEHGDLDVEQHDTPDEVVADLKAILKRPQVEDCEVVVFHATRIRLSRGPLRHLLLPTGAVPLYDHDRTLEPDESTRIAPD
jgi:hypothetical protein